MARTAFGRPISRAIQLPSNGPRRRLLTVPLLGKIAAGRPIPIPPEVLPAGYEELEVTEDQTRGRSNAFALRVEGTSMIDALINDGDIVVLEGTDRAQNGEMVAAWLTGFCVAGLAATILLDAENLISWRAGKRWAMLWSSAFIFVVISILIV